MTPEQVREVAQGVAVAAWSVAERYLRRTQNTFTPAEHAITVSRFHGAAIDYIIRGDAEQASEYLRDAADIEAALRVIRKHDTIFASHCGLLPPRGIEDVLKSFGDGFRRAGAAYKKTPENRGFFYCLGRRFASEPLPTAVEAVQAFRVMVEAIQGQDTEADYDAGRDGSYIRRAMRAGQRG